MTESPDIEARRKVCAEAEARVKAIAEMPPSLSALRDAIEVVAAVYNVKIELKLDKSLQVRVPVGPHHVSHFISLHDDGYHIFYAAPPDTGTFIRGLEDAAWEVATGWRWRPRHLYAAPDRLRREGKQTKGVPVKYILEEVEREKIGLPGQSAKPDEKRQ